MKVFLIVPKGIVILGAYTRETLAERHARTELGTEYQSIEVLDELPDSVMDSLCEYDEDDVTPVEMINLETEITKKLGK